METKAEARILSVIKFGDEYFGYGDIVAIFTRQGKTHVGRIVYYSDSDNIQHYIALDTSKLFESSEVRINLSDIADIAYNREAV